MAYLFVVSRGCGINVDKVLELLTHKRFVRHLAVQILADKRQYPDAAMPLLPRRAIGRGGRV